MIKGKKKMKEEERLKEDKGELASYLCGWYVRTFIALVVDRNSTRQTTLEYSREPVSDVACLLTFASELGREGELDDVMEEMVVDRDEDVSLRCDS